jgi:hypothetical protein
MNSSALVQCTQGNMMPVMLLMGKPEKYACPRWELIEPTTFGVPAPLINFPEAISDLIHVNFVTAG